MVWIAIAYNLYYAVAYPIYNTANVTLVLVATRDSKKRGVLAFAANVAGLAVMGAGSMVFPLLVSFALKENQNLWFLTMSAIAVFAALAIYLQFRFTRDRGCMGASQSILSIMGVVPMVAATPVCNLVFSGLLNAFGYDQAADVALGTAAQSAAVRNVISISYIGVETAAYLLCAVLIFFFTVEDRLAKQADIEVRQK